MLDASRNLLTAVPNFDSLLPALTTVDLSYNQLQVLPDAWGGTPALSGGSAKLAFNPLRRLPARMVHRLAHFRSRTSILIDGLCSTLHWPA